MGEHALIFHFVNIGRRAEEMGIDALDALLVLQAQLAQAIEPGGIGQVDGHEIAMDDTEGSLYTYGVDAKAMLKAALPAVCRSSLAAGGRAYLRYGAADDDSAVEENFLLSDLCAKRNG
jgi:hypothetical protein